MFEDNKMIRSHKCGLEPFDKIINLFENIAMKNSQASQEQIHKKLSKKKHNWYLTVKTLVKTNLILDIEEEPFETLNIVEVAMNNDNNEFRKTI